MPSVSFASYTLDTSIKVFALFETDNSITFEFSESLGLVGKLP